MGYAQMAAGYSAGGTAPVSPAYQFPAPTNPASLMQFNTQFNQVMTATGIGIGNISAHETGHQLALPEMDCSVGTWIMHRTSQPSDRPSQLVHF
jgi:hypothetical protein